MPIKYLKVEHVPDIHCHILPGIDDGPSSLDEALAMACLAASAGTDTIIATPHFANQLYEVDTSMINQGCARLTAELEKKKIHLNLLPGAEIMLGYDTGTRLEKGILPSLAGTDQYYLFELPNLFIPDAVLKIFQHIKDLGVIPILAHPERNSTLVKKSEIISELEFIGVRFQITAASLTGRFGVNSAKSALSLLKERNVHYIASDGHDSKDRKPLLMTIFNKIKKIVGAARAFEIMVENPRQILSRAPALQKKSL